LGGEGVEKEKLYYFFQYLPRPNHTNNNIMKYIVTKKCYANEFVSVIAESEEEALLKAMDNDCKSLGNNLEFNGYQPTRKWQVEELETITPQGKTNE